MANFLLRSLFLVLAFGCAAFAQAKRVGETLVILPFENQSRSPGLEWIGDSFPETLGQRMSAKSLYVVRRDERLYAFERLGIPTGLRPSRATSYRVAQEVGADYVVFGRYGYDGSTLQMTAQLLKMSTLKLMPEVTHSGPLPSLLELQTVLAGDVLRLIDPELANSAEKSRKSASTLRLDVFENYVRGLVANSRPEQIRHFKEALRLSPNYTPAMFQLGRAYYAGRDYPSAVSWLARIGKSDPLALEANFYLGMAAYYAGDFQRAEAAFAFLSAQMPLGEIYNNLGVVSSRRGKSSALNYFRKAVENDPRDPDYRFNLAVNLYREGDLSGAATQLREMLAIRTNDREAQALLDTVTARMARADSSIQPLAFPLERIKSDYDETFFRHLTSELREQQAPRPGNGDATQPYEPAH